LRARQQGLQAPFFVLATPTPRKTAVARETSSSPPPERSSEEEFMSKRFQRDVLRALQSAFIAYLPIILMALVRKGLARRASRSATEAEA
jgi:hypothetical protein